MRDQLVPEGPWRFDEAVAEVFDDMLARSIPGYHDMRRLVADLAARILPEGGHLVDLGCARGEALASVLGHPACAADVTALGVDVAPSMLKAATARFAGDRRVAVEHHDLRGGPPATAADVVLAVLTVQFTPIEWRPRLLQAIRDQLRPQGALILVEKVLGSTAGVDQVLTSVYRQHKRTEGYSDDQIERKALSLEGVLVPVTSRWNEDLLRSAGFSEVEPFWRWGPFAGWLALR